MAYRMSIISEHTRVGVTSKGEINVEVWAEEIGEGEASETFIPAQDAEEVAKYILRKT